MHEDISYKATAYTKEEKASERQQNRKIKLDKIPLPKFDGNRRHYPKFKKDFSKLILPNIADAEAAFTLRQCVTKEVVLCFASCEEEVEEMMKKLDAKYGDLCQLVDVFISEIRMLKKVSEEDSPAMIKLVNTIERGYNDLKNMHLEIELCNATVTKEIENKIPRNVALM